MKAVETDMSLPKLEQEAIAFWREQNIALRSMDNTLPSPYVAKGEKRKSYVFYDGPPFATGLPHYGHLLAGTIKDVVGRFFTMKGFHVDRRLGWDCHGVPVEFEIQKKLELHGAKAIREYGVGNFNEACREIVLRYTEEWKEFIERSGRLVDFSRPYRTMDPDFMESIWWVVKRLWDRGLIYEGVKCVPYSWAINTPLSNFEANLNYKNVQDPAVTVRAEVISDLAKKLQFTLPKGAKLNVYVWTTTPWTLPSNMCFAVGPVVEYSLVYDSNKAEVAIVATALIPSIFPEFESEGLSVLATCKGKDLEGVEYKPFFPYFEAERAKNAFRIYADDFVSDSDGTGIVHCASFGEDDLRVFLAHGITVVDPVDEDGAFTDAVSDFAGLNVKAADPKIIQYLKDHGAMVSHKTIEHSYPFCWRTDTPLIYKSISTWFVKVETFRDCLQQNNSAIHWVPEHIRDGRFGKWLENARDWAISRNRFWGTPIPVWRCSSCSNLECIGSVEELQQKTSAVVTDLHSHFIDKLQYDCPSCKAKQGMVRIPEVLDCWFESGAMPYAQEHYPFRDKEGFEQNFPADFIAEGLDQTRGWFYTLLVLSTALFGERAFKNVIVNGIVLAEDGKKMSKSLKNYPPPEEVMNEFGADAMRLYLLSSPATRGEDLRFSKAGVQQVVRQTLLPLWNAYNFLVTYAIADGWTPSDTPETASSNLLDRWLLSKVGSLVNGVDQALSSYHLYAAAPSILEFVDQLTNWYIRLNRRRFWAGNTDAEKEDKFHAYATLHRSLLAFVRVLAPLAPFISETIFRNLAAGVKGMDYDSVHLAPFPSSEELAAAGFEGRVVDPELEKAMEYFEEVILLGRSLRNDTGLKVRQPLAKLTIVHSEQAVLDGLDVLSSYVREELNIKEIAFSHDEASYVTLTARLNTKKLGKVLGPKLGSDGMKRLRDAVEKLPTSTLAAIERGETIEFEGETLGSDDILVERKAREGSGAIASSGQITILLDTALTQELRLEGLAREFVSRVQKLRKDFNFEVTDRIVVRYMTGCPRLSAALEDYAAYVQQETLTVELKAVSSEAELNVDAGARSEILEIEEKSIALSLIRIQA